MGKQGPCRHCGVTTTPLWRNGPPDKPVLCNACGSRWRTKGSLTNYTPLHARELIEPVEDPKVSRVKIIPFKPKEKKLHKIKQSGFAAENEREMPYTGQNFRKILEGDTSNRSSSGSATSYSESCAHFGTTEASEVTASAQSNVWEPQVPSKKRTCILRTKPSHSPSPSPVEKLTKDLYTIMCEQQSSYFSSSSEDLLYESKTPIGSFEIGNGSVLLSYPNPRTIEEESEASSFPIDNKSNVINEAYSGSASFPINSEMKRASFSAGFERFKKSASSLHVKRDKTYSEKMHLLQDKDSPLGFADLKDVVNFEVLMRHMTDDEQQQLMKYLPSVDITKYPESLRNMFNSPQFAETLSSFQQLLKEGLFDSAYSGMDGEECRYLKRLVLHNSSRCTWVERYQKIKNVKDQKNVGGKEAATGSNFLGHSNSTSLKRARDTQNLHLSELKGDMRSPKRVPKSGFQLNSRSIYEAEEFIDDDGACFSPRTIFASPPERSSLLCSLQFTDDSSDHDLLLDVPHNTSSFPEAELLNHPWDLKRGTQFPASSFSTQKPRNG